MKKARANKIVITAGGTGGHVFPGLALAKALQEKNYSVLWLGTNHGIEARLVPENHIPLQIIHIRGLRGKSILQKLLTPFRLIKATFEAFRFLRHEKPDVVVGMGGYVAGPGGIAAKLAGIPLIIHEQNSIAGMTNRYLAKIANKVLCGFPEVFPAKTHALVVGNPVRKEISRIPQQVRHDTVPHLLIIGGSLGAQILNEIVPQALSLLPSNVRPEVWHQTGQKDYDATVRCYKTLGITAKIVPFIDDMADAYQWADLLLSRAGALTIAELTTVGLAAILIPYPHAVDDHQTVNAQYVVKAGGAVLIPQKTLTPSLLSTKLKQLFTEPELLQKMSAASRQLRKENIIETMIDVINTL